MPKRFLITCPTPCLVKMGTMLHSVKCMGQPPPNSTNPAFTLKEEAASVQHVKNVDVMVQYEELWRLLYSKHKLGVSDRRAFQHALEDVTYTCGAQLQDLELGERFVGVFVRQIRCYDPVEKLSVGKYQPICIYCSSEDIIGEHGERYPMYADCIAAEKETIQS